jgi:hypothetical protein
MRRNVTIECVWTVKMRMFGGVQMLQPKPQVSRQQLTRKRLESYFALVGLDTETETKVIPKRSDCLHDLYMVFMPRDR